MRLRQWIASLTLGILLGAVLMMLSSSRDLSQLYLTVKQLRAEVEDLERENLSIHMQIHTPTNQPVIQSIHVICTNHVDKSTQLAAEKFAKQQLTFLLGRDVSSLYQDPQIPRRILDDKIITVGQVKFRLRVSLVIISEVIEVHITVRPFV